MMKNLCLSAFWLMIGLGCLLSAQAQKKPRKIIATSTNPLYNDSLYRAIEWRNIGPFRGGRSTAIAGITSQPYSFFVGYTGGGVWKTEDAGITWKNVSDGFLKTSTIGSIAVAESDPNVVFVGTGESPIRGVATSHGDGVYKSTDGGRNWKKTGLEKTRHISRVRIHPQNPDLIYVAAQGEMWQPKPDRGVYRSKDGGKTWERILFVDEKTGPSDLSMDATNPRILYAAFWEHQRTPWKVISGGKGSGIYKSEDGGDTWKKLTEGLPKDIMGKIGVVVSPAAPNRVWAIIEAKEGGLYRSDNYGKTWQRINKERVLQTRSWYYMHIFADPQNAETVYVLNAPMLKSIDGGKSFTVVESPHGDNHDLWINPNNPLAMINANDGGGSVSLNGGQTWSTQNNQPTAQFYRVIADNRFPYWVYGGQQDNTSVATASRSMAGSIGWKDWHDIGGGESAYVAFDPNNPEYVYAGSYQGIISEYTASTQSLRDIMAYPTVGLASIPKDSKYRFNWNAPIIVSAHNPKVIYQAGNKLLRSSDRGANWQEISPDLTRNDTAHLGQGGGPITNEGAGGEVYHTIFYVAESPQKAGTLYVGTDDGLVHLTQNDGQTWTNITPKGLGECQINAIDASPHDPATAYVAVTKYKLADYTPLIYKTSDYGKTWVLLTKGIPAEAFARVVREDPVRKGLLYAGTEAGMFVSFNDGHNWQPLQNNLPVVPITDLFVKGNDLIASTQGRAFWILDDLSPLRQITDAVAKAPVHLFKPGTTYRADMPTDPNPVVAGKNPPNGAIIYYHLTTVPADTIPLTLDIFDKDNQLIRSYTSKKIDPPVPGAPEQVLVPKNKGMNRFVWDLRVENTPPVAGAFLYGSPLGHRVLPGRYQVRLKLRDQEWKESFEVLPDPRIKVSDAEKLTYEKMLLDLHANLVDMHQSVAEIRKAKQQVKDWMDRTEKQPNAEEIKKMGKNLTDKLSAWEESIIQPKQETFQDVINFQNRLEAEFNDLQMRIDGTTPPLTKGMETRFQDLRKDWEERKAALQKLVGEDIAQFNNFLRDKNVPAVIIQTPVAPAKE